MQYFFKLLTDPKRTALCLALGIVVTDLKILFTAYCHKNLYACKLGVQVRHKYSLCLQSQHPDKR